MTNETRIDDLQDRCVLVYIDRALLIEVLNWCHAPEGHRLNLPAECGLPDDCQVREVFYAAARRSLAFLVHHKSFDEVSRGCTPPVHAGYFTPIRTITKVDDLLARAVLMLDELNSRRLDDTWKREEIADLLDEIHAVVPSPQPLCDSAP